MGLDDFSSPLLSLSRVVVFYCEVDGCVNHLCVNAADFRGVLGQPVKHGLLVAPSSFSASYLGIAAAGSK